MEELGTPYPLVAERMGHEGPGMRGVYSHVSESMRRALTEALQGMWEGSFHHVRHQDYHGWWYSASIYHPGASELPE